MADLSAFDTRTQAERGVDMPIYDPKGNLTDIIITVAGADSDRVREVFERRWDERIKGGKRLVPSAKENKAGRIEQAVAATLGWKNIQHEGKDLECTPENARMLYTRYPAILRRVTDFSDDESNFTNAAAGE